MTDGLKEAFKDAQKHAQDKIMITCCKCHGKGEYEAYEWDEEIKCIKYPKTAECELCHGTGKISLQFYEDIQKGCRR